MAGETWPNLSVPIFVNDLLNMRVSVVRFVRGVRRKIDDREASQRVLYAGPMTCSSPQKLTGVQNSRISHAMRFHIDRVRLTSATPGRLVDKAGWATARGGPYFQHFNNQSHR